MNRVITWIRTNYGWREKKRDWLTLIVILAGLVVTIMVFVEPVIGIVILLVALALSVRSVQKTRERRHQEMLEATRKQPGQ